MTFRQILAVLWTRRWIIVAVVLFALCGAGGYLALRTVSYNSEGIIRMNAVVSGGATSDDVGGVAVNFGVETITSPDVLDAAGAFISEPGTDLAGQVKAHLVDDGHVTKAVIDATGATPQISQRRAAAVIKAYNAHIDAEMKRVLSILQQRKQDAVAQAQLLQGQVRADPSNSIAATNLATELSRMSAISTQIDSINNAGAVTSVLVAAPAGAPTVPSALIVLLLAVSTGLIVGIATALIRDQFDNRIRDEDDIEARFDVPVIGSLIWDRQVAKMSPPLPVASDDRTDLGEGLRTARLTLQVLVPPQGAFVVTSVEPGDGKSFVSANLALAWARAGKRVILVGGDLRRPVLSRYYGDAADGQGLAEVLHEWDTTSKLRERDLLLHLNNTRYRRLRILPAGDEPAEPADLLARAGVGELIAFLRTQADIVVIDAPPALGMADSALLASHTDGAVVIATAGRTDRARLADAIARLRANGVTVLGVMVNRSTRRLPRAYSTYYQSERRPDPGAARDERDASAQRSPSGTSLAPAAGYRRESRRGEDDGEAEDSTAVGNARGATESP